MHPCHLHTWQTVPRCIEKVKEVHVWMREPAPGFTVHEISFGHACETLFSLKSVLANRTGCSVAKFSAHKTCNVVDNAVSYCCVCVRFIKIEDIVALPASFVDEPVKLSLYSSNFPARCVAEPLYISLISAKVTTAACLLSGSVQFPNFGGFTK